MYRAGTVRINASGHCSNSYVNETWSLTPCGWGSSLESVSIIEKLRDAVTFMSGSSDFCPEGQAYVGWLSARQKLDKAANYVKNLESIVN